MWRHSFGSISINYIDQTRSHGHTTCVFRHQLIDELTLRITSLGSFHVEPVLNIHLNGLAKRLRRLQLVDDALHVWFVGRVAVEQRRPLIGSDPQSGFGGDLDDLCVVLPPEGLVRPELFLELHQRRVSFPFRHCKQWPMTERLTTGPTMDSTPAPFRIKWWKLMTDDINISNTKNKTKSAQIYRRRDEYHFPRLSPSLLPSPPTSPPPETMNIPYVSTAILK